MLIHKIVVACFKYDLFLLRICVASIRYWYAEVEIFLIKDTKRGEFDTNEIETHFNVKVLETSGKYYGYGYSKLEALFLPFERFLLLDADTVFVGKVLDELSQFDEEYIVTGVYDPHEEGSLIKNYIDTKKIKKEDPSYCYPGYGINTGHIVISPGYISPSDIEQMFYYENGIKQQYFKDCLPHADQGILNYLLARKKSEQRFRIKYHSFWLWPPYSEELKVEALKEKKGKPFIIHWAGPKPLEIKDFPRRDVLEFYDNYYYSQIPFGTIKKLIRRLN